jgi:hypothetical protein
MVSRTLLVSLIYIGGLYLIVNDMALAYLNDMALIYIEDKPSAI